MSFVELSADDPRLVRFYDGIYLEAFATQREPLTSWQAALRGEAVYEMRVRVALDEGGEVIGGIAYELYPRSRCGFVTYMVVAPTARRRGLGRQLLSDATADLYTRGAVLVVGEVNDPQVHGAPARPRLERFERWGARVLDVGYVQPSLGEGLARDRGLCLIVFPQPAGELPPIAAGALRSFLHELYIATEGCEPDRELQQVLDGVGDRIALR